MDSNDEFQYNEEFPSDIFKYIDEINHPVVEKTDNDLKAEVPSVKIGLSTEQANRRFIKKLTEFLNRCDNKINYKLLVVELQKSDLILTFVSVSLLLGCFIYLWLFNDQKDIICDLWQYIVELVVLVPWILLNIYVKILIKISNINRKSNRLKEILDFLNINRNVTIYESEHKNYNLDPPSSDFLSIYRDYQWVRLPRNVIVKGDVFKLQINQIFPCECKLVIDYVDHNLITGDEVYNMGETCKFIGDNSENELFIDGTFVALDDSFTHYLEYYVSNFKSKSYDDYYNNRFMDHDFNNYYGMKPKDYNKKQVIWNYSDNYIFLNNNNKIIIIVVITLTIILNVMWNYLFNIQNKVVILINMARIIILLDFIGLDPMYKLLELWGNIKLLSLFEIHHEHKFMKGLDSIRSMSSSSFLSNSSYSSESSDFLVNEMTYSFQFKQIKRVLRKGLCDEFSLIKQLSCVTLLSFIDDIGILLNSNQSLQEISVITQRNPGTTVENVDKELPEQESIGVKLNSSAYQPIDHFETTVSNPDVNRIYTNLFNDISDIYLDPYLDKDAEGLEDDLLILDVFNDVNLYGKDNIRFTTDHERNCKSQLKPLVFSMSLTALPSCIPLYSCSPKRLKQSVNNPKPAPNVGVSYAAENNVQPGTNKSAVSKGDGLEPENSVRSGDDTTRSLRDAELNESPVLNNHVSDQIRLDESVRLDSSVRTDPNYNRHDSKSKNGKPRGKGLYKNYISSLINSDLDNFNNCLCTLTNVLGIKKLYLKRYKLLKFVLFNYTSLIQAPSETTDPTPSKAPKSKRIKVDDEKSDNEDDKILLYFYRDTNKKVIQMLIKCRISIINNYKLNYYNGNKIINLNKRIKRKIKDLNMQWLSNGMNTFLYFYKPISINDFNIFLFLLPYITVYNIIPKKYKDKNRESSVNKLHLVKKNENYMFMYKYNPLYYKYRGLNIKQLSTIYKTNLSQSENKADSQTKGADSKLNKILFNRDTVLGSYLGKMLNLYIKNSILLGMAATRHTLPKEISNRIYDLHEAGIRFVYFSKHNEKITRIIGGLLGLETSWNSMISLSATETTSFINQEGHTVLPNGIDNIRQHIQHVDDIPLQVSLYCNCNCDNIVEMLDILNENGERIMCVGSGLNPNNFYLFNNSHISFSISLNYNPICKFCKGKRWQGISKAHIFEEPRPEFKLSSLITSLTSSLQTTQLYKVSDPDFIFEMLFELFREARKMATNLQEAICFMLLSYYSLVWMYFLQQLLSLPQILTTFDFTMIVFVYIPLLSLTLISNPGMERIMDHLPNKIIQTGRLTFNHYVRTYLRLLVMSVFMIVIFYIHIYYSNLYINDKFSLNNPYCKNFLYYPRYRCVESVIKFLSDDKGYDKYVCILLSQNFTSISFVALLVASSISWINNYSYIDFDTFKNVKWIVALMLILGSQISIVVVKMILLKLTDTAMMKMMIKNTSFTLLLIIPILLVDQIIKFFIIKNKNTQQKFLKLLFSTRLGTWSPK